MITFKKTLLGSMVAMTTLCTVNAAEANVPSARRNALEGLATLGAAGYDVLVGADGGLLAPGGTVTRQVLLEGGREYAIAAGGCDDAFDVDLAVMDPLGQVIAGDTTQNPDAAVRVVAPMSGVYTIVVKLADSTWDGAHWTLLVNTSSR